MYFVNIKARNSEMLPSVPPSVIDLHASDVSCTWSFSMEFRALPRTSCILFLVYFSGENTWFWQKQPNKLFVLLGKLFIFAFTWAFGGMLRREDEHEGETLIGISTTNDDLANLTRDFNFLIRDIFESQPSASKFHNFVLFTICNLYIVLIQDSF